MIRVKDVHKRYGSQVVLDGVTFRVENGSITTIIGRSGQGKSVLLRHLMGLELPDSGSIVINGEEIVGMKTRDLNRIRRCFGFLFQDGALFDSLSVRENVAFPLREHTDLSEKEIMDVVSDKFVEVGVTGHADKAPGEVSGGMRKRVGLARALAMDPDIVFFDEPTSGLDPITKGAIYSLISKTHVERAVTYVLVSHDIQGVLDVSEKVMLLFDGKIRQEGTPEEIRNSSDPVIQQFITGSPDGPIPID
jgi:phospholipid/cholesterol/gamma-HCH transport system ATP-binding protein